MHPCWTSFFVVWASDLLAGTSAYYLRQRCFGTGDCILLTGDQAGGMNDEYHRWNVECNDGEAMIGVFDEFTQFAGIGQVWCRFMFPRKPPSRGIYPYYELCNVRNITLREYYCYDKYFPKDTIDTFVTGFFSPSMGNPMTPVLMKCCKTPDSYRLDYRRCHWRYTHDKAGEHYENVWLTECHTGSVMTGLGQGVNPWDGTLHFTWIQCCPVVSLPTRHPNELPW